MSTQANSKNIAVVLASGAGTRFRSETPKQFLKLAGKTVLEHTLDVFESHPQVDEVIVVAAANNALLVEELVNNAGYRKVTKIVVGGESRQESSASGIAAISGDDHKVLVHDAVRPLLDHATISRCIVALDGIDAVDTAVASSDTVIRLDKDDLIDEIPDRSTLQLGQTPQGFRSGILREAHRRAAADANVKVTDDCGLVLRYGLSTIKVVLGDINNIKITHPSDIYLADRLFQLRSQSIDSSTLEGRLDGRIVVIFGGSRGIGKAIAELAIASGARVKSVSRENGIDVGDHLSVRKVLQSAQHEFGRIDIVVNTAGVLRSGLLDGQPYEAIEDQIRTNFIGSVVVAKESLIYLRKTAGSVVLFASSSYTRGRARYSVYSATKAAVVNLTQALAQEFSPFGVRINAVNPERTATPMRTENFGIEAEGDLLEPRRVAEAALLVAISQSSGEVVDVRR